MSRHLIPLAAFVVLAAAMFNAGGLALFTDSQDIDANTFTTTDVDISTSPTTALVTYSDMVPGDSVTSAVVVSNAGGADLRYAITSSATNADSKGLKDQLVLTIKTIDVTNPGTPCDDFDGTQLYTGDVDGTTGALVGNVASGADSGDRSVAAAASETLCFKVELPIGTGNAFQNAATTATFTFSAEQTKNN